MMEYSLICTPSRLALSTALFSSFVLKPMMMAFDALASSTSLSVIGPTAVCTKSTSTFLLSIWLSEVMMASSEPCTSALSTRRRLLCRPVLRSKRLSSVARCGATSFLLRSMARRSSLSSLGVLLGGHDQEFVARHRQAGEADHLHRRARAGFLDRLAQVVEERLDLARLAAADERVTRAESARLHDDRRGRAAPGFESALR